MGLLCRSSSVAGAAGRVPAVSLYVMGRIEPRRSAGIKRAEAAGAALLAGSALAYWTGYTTLTGRNVDASGRHMIFHFFGLSREMISGGVVILSLAAGAVGLVLLARGLIGRIRTAWIRQAAGWTTAAAGLLALPAPAMMAFIVLSSVGLAGDQVRVEADDGRSVVLTQDGFDGDRVDVYTRQGPFTYVRTGPADGLSSFPRVKDRDCALDSADEGSLLLTCGTETVAISP